MRSNLQIDIANEQALLPVNESRLREAVVQILLDAGVHGGSVSVAVLDDAAIHQINLDFLQHDYPTDVLSFALEEDFKSFEGEVLVSAETARRNATVYGWSAEDELLLYAIHGTLHLVGYRDKTEGEQAEMREAEARYLQVAGVKLKDSADGNVGPTRITPQHSALEGV